MIKEKNKKQEDKKIVLCGVQGCCPTLEIKGKLVTISDDFGNKVKLSKEQLKNLIKIAQNKYNQ